MTEHIVSMCRTLGSIPSIKREKKKTTLDFLAFWKMTFILGHPFQRHNEGCS